MIRSASQVCHWISIVTRTQLGYTTLGLISIQIEARGPQGVYLQDTLVILMWWPCNAMVILKRSSCKTQVYFVVNQFRLLVPCTNWLAQIRLLHKEPRQRDVLIHFTQWAPKYQRISCGYHNSITWVLCSYQPKRACCTLPWTPCIDHR
jgi:hypothetical protein